MIQIDQILEFEGAQKLIFDQNCPKIERTDVSELDNHQKVLIFTTNLIKISTFLFKIRNFFPN